MRAVVMGGTSGIGLAAAVQLTGCGIDVTVTGRDSIKLSAVAGQVAGAEPLDGTDQDDNHNSDQNSNTLNPRDLGRQTRDYLEFFAVSDLVVGRHTEVLIETQTNGDDSGDQQKNLFMGVEVTIRGIVHISNVDNYALLCDGGLFDLMRFV